MKRTFIFILALLSVSAFAQNADMPTDFLTKDFHKGRRDLLREKLPANSVAVFFANAVRNRANDVDYVYHQDPDFFYLTGYKEPDAALFVFKDKQTANNGASYNEIIFVQPRDERAEMWTGRRMGDQAVKTQLGLDQAFNNTEFKKYNVNFSKFDQILFFDFKNDVRDNARDSSDLYDIIAMFKSKVNYPSKDNTLSVTAEPQKSNINTKDLNTIMGSLRGFKTKEEVEMIRKA